MKKIVRIILITFSLSFPLFLIAQQKIEIKMDKVNLSKGNQPVYVVLIPEANLESVSKEWIKIIRQNTKSKVVESGSEINIQGTQIPEIYEKPINLYSAILGQDSAIKLVAAFEIDSVFFELTENNKTIYSENIHNSIKGFLRNFAVGQYKVAVQDQLDLEEKKLGSLNKEFDDLNKQVENDRKEIKEKEQNIKNSQDAIASYEKDNERKVAEINSKKESNAKIEDNPELQKVAKEQLKELEKEKKSIENNLEKEQKNIVKYQADIDELNRAVENNLKLIEEKKTQITGQEDVVKKVTATLNGIK
jgi:DNA repair exonuclease SbcCD ATPase subunit